MADLETLVAEPREDVERTVRFYADPDTYFAVAFPVRDDFENLDESRMEARQTRLRTAGDD